MLVPVSNALTGGNCWWDGNRFHIEATSVGPTSTIGYAAPTGTGTDVSAPLRLTQVTGATIPVPGTNAETPLEAAIAIRAFPTWYGFMFAVDTELDDLDTYAVASYIEACSPMAIYGYTTSQSVVIDPTVDTDIASILHDATVM